MAMVSLEDVTCPHCLRENTALECMSEFTLTRKRLLALVFICRSCNGVVVAEISPDENTVRGGGYISRSQNYNMDIHFSPDDDTHGIVIDVYPKASIPLAPAHVPDNIADAFIEAKDNLTRARYSTSVMLSRKALDLATKHLGVAEGVSINDLSKRVFQLRESGKITPEMAQWAKIIRIDGNSSAHSDEVFSEADATEIINFIETFLLYAFTLPNMVAVNKHTQ